MAIAGSLLLHIGLLVLLMPSAKGLASVGTAGVGSVDGAGTAVVLVDASELEPTKPSATPSSAARQETAVSETAAIDATTGLTDTSEPVDAVNDETDSQKPPEPDRVRPESRLTSETAADAAAGAHGQNGRSNTDLWNAIAPCWNRIADKNTLSATLTISFAEDGGLAVAPIIERDPDVAITNQNLQSEAKALAALSECGPYPMAKDEVNVAVVFPAPLNQ